MRIQAGWTFGGTITNAAMTVTEATGSLDFNIECNASGIEYDDAAGGANTTHNSATTWAHEAMNTVITGYDDFATVLESALNSASGAEGNGWTYTVTYSTSTMSYTVSAAEGSTALAFAVANPFRHILGFTGTQGSAASHTSDMRPYYTVLPTLAEKSKVSGDYEPPGLIQGSIANSGAHYSIGPTTLPTMYDWTAEFEASAPAHIATLGTAVYATSATTTIPWSWEAFWKHCRAREPFLVADSLDTIVHYMRPEAAHFRPLRRQVDWDKWDLDLMTYNRGRV